MDARELPELQFREGGFWLLYPGAEEGSFPDARAAYQAAAPVELCDHCWSLAHGGAFAVCQDDCGQSLDHWGICQPRHDPDAPTDCQVCGGDDRLTITPLIHVFDYFGPWQDWPAVRDPRIELAQLVRDRWQRDDEAWTNSALDLAAAVLARTDPGERKTTRTVRLTLDVSVPVGVVDGAVAAAINRRLDEGPGEATWWGDWEVGAAEILRSWPTRPDDPGPIETGRII